MDRSESQDAELLNNLIAMCLDAQPTSVPLMVRTTKYRTVRFQKMREPESGEYA